MTVRYCIIAVALLMSQTAGAQNLNNKKIDGYKGIWFTLGQFNTDYGDKYSGGLGTYTAKHRPLAIYAEAVNRTYFVYGGTTSLNEKHLLCMIAYYDHSTGEVPKPTVVHDKLGVDDPHDNPSLLIDGEGYIWVFVSGRGRIRPGFKYRSQSPYSIDAFKQITEEEMTYPQPHFDDTHGFFNFFTKYTGVRELYFESSSNGISWTSDLKLAGIIEEGASKSGHYQVSGKYKNTLCTFFSRHPDGNVDRRTDLFYVQTKDFGTTWSNGFDTPLSLPLIKVENPARVINYTAQGKNVYLKDLNFDQYGNPVCLYLTSNGHLPGPDDGPRDWKITGLEDGRWYTRTIFQSDHNYDMGSLYIQGDLWSIMAPSNPGPQKHHAGGEVVIWESQDNGKSWQPTIQATIDSQVNHNYIRRPLNAKAQFFCFWADGDPSKFSKSMLYFSDDKGQVYQLPYHMNSSMATPVKHPQ